LPGVVTTPCGTPGRSTPTVTGGKVRMNFWQELILQSVGPLITVAGIGFVANLITRRAQDRREANQLRYELIRQMTEPAWSLYFATRDYWLPSEESRHARDDPELDKQFRASRAAGEALENRLEAYFESPEPKRLWHSTMDLLRVQYLHYINSPVSVAIWAGPEHTGLNPQQLKDPERVRRAYQERFPQAINSVLREPLKNRLGARWKFWS
jgi:hypothetical protein